MDTESAAALHHVRHLLQDAAHIAMLTGAGVSAESGVPTFRDAQTGLWARFRAEDLATEEAFRRDPERVWDWYAERRVNMRDVRPNAGHVAVARFQQRHPRITVQLQLTEQLPDLAAEGYDGAVWLWAVQGRQASQWTSRQLAANQRVLVAAPAYLARHGTPARVEELARHACLIARENGNSTGPRFDVWQLQHVQSGTPAKVRIQGPLASNSGELVRDWCVGGNGIMLRSLWDIAPLLTNGQLVRVLPDWAMPDANIHWLAPWRAQTPKRVRLLTDYLVEQFQDAPWRINP